MIGFQSLEDFLRIMENRRCGIHREGLARRDTAAMPSIRLIIIDDGHVVGEDPAETGIFQAALALLVRNGILMRFEGERDVAVVEGFLPAHGPPVTAAVAAPQGSRPSPPRRAR